jgi:hypothetical protein
MPNLLPVGRQGLGIAFSGFIKEHLLCNEDYASTKRIARLFIFRIKFQTP